MRTISRYGWHPSLPDPRDFKYPYPLGATINFPPEVDMRPLCPPIYDQGQLGSCTANAIAAAIQMAGSANDPTAPLPPMPSRLFIYWNERFIEGGLPNTKHDSGAQIRDGFKAIASSGICLEDTWPYTECLFADKPKQIAYDEAACDKAIVYSAVDQNLTAFKSALASGFPIVFGFTVFDSFEDPSMARTGVARMPASGEQVVGGHAVLCVGYDDSIRYFWVRNSWGDRWGKAGYFLMPYDYLMDPGLASDFWVLKKTT